MPEITEQKLWECGFCGAEWDDASDYFGGLIQWPICGDCEHDQREPIPCRNCNGQGTIIYAFQREECTKCFGTGRVGGVQNEAPYLSSGKMAG